MKAIKYPCKECDNDVLIEISNYECFAECSVCGHPNDTPTPEQVKSYNATYLSQVSEFHQAFNSPIPPTPQIPQAHRADLRVSLLQEELDELKQAIADGNLIEAADALCDLQYVLSGAVLEFGLGDKFASLFAEVHRSNMSKACSSYEEAMNTCGHYDEKGTPAYIVGEKGKFIVYRIGDHKTLKSVGYSPADLKKILEA